MPIVTLFERDYSLKTMAMGFYVTLKLFFTLEIHFLSMVEAASLSTSAHSFCSWKAESTNSDCTSEGLILGLFLPNWSTVLDFSITGQVSPVMVHCDSFLRVTKVFPRITWHKEAYMSTSFTNLSAVPFFFRIGLCLLHHIFTLKGQRSLIHLYEPLQSA